MTSLSLLSPVCLAPPSIPGTRAAESTTMDPTRRAQIALSKKVAEMIKLTDAKFADSGQLREETEALNDEVVVLRAQVEAKKQAQQQAAAAEKPAVAEDGDGGNKSGELCVICDVGVCVSVWACMGD